MELTATEKNRLTQAITTQIKALEEADYMVSGLSHAAHQAVTDEIKAYRKLKDKIGA